MPKIPNIRHMHITHNRFKNTVLWSIVQCYMQHQTAPSNFTCILRSKYNLLVCNHV